MAAVVMTSDIVERVDSMRDTDGLTYDQIAGALNLDGLRTAKGDLWNKATLTDAYRRTVGRLPRRPKAAAKPTPSGVRAPASQWRPLSILQAAEVAALLHVTTEELDLWRRQGRGPLRRSTGDYVAWEVATWADSPHNSRRLHDTDSNDQIEVAA